MPCNVWVGAPPPARSLPHRAAPVLKPALLTSSGSGQYKVLGPGSPERGQGLIMLKSGMEPATREEVGWRNLKRSQLKVVL